MGVDLHHSVTLARSAGGYPPDIYPAAACEHEANVDGADVMLWRPAEPTCARQLCEWCCDEKCCRCCHAEDVLADELQCPSCLTEQAETERKQGEER